MRIAVVNSKFASPHLGGGVTSLLTLLEGLNDERRISVDAFQTPPVADIDVSFIYNVYSQELPSVPVFYWIEQGVGFRYWKNFVMSNIDDEYDLFIGQGTLGLASIEAADIHDTPSVLFIRSLISTGYYQYHPRKSHLSNLLRADIGGKLQYLFVLQNHRRYRRAVEDADVVVANSEFTASKIEELYDVDPEIIYPPINISDYEVEYDPDGYITIVNPRDKNKGGDIFLDIAEEIPEEKFLIVGEVPKNLLSRVQELDNVTYEEWCDDMREVYGQSKMVVAPTRVVETFGRVPAEAMVSGIPCVVSNRGGLPYVVGDTGYVVENVESVDEWVDKIRDAEEDDMHEQRKERVRQKFSTEEQVRRFSRIVEELQNG